ncbi:MAG: hypothetical protein GW815_01925 [Candidatus Moranbacteria bacterium]|nr:hypothetical protein [Candidatus Moranbacteria bacterium]OIQ03959.1 MAG: hypothetical protein AUK58_01390 [Candidatus Moranbacteria bacterium CG2_30_41_165]PIP25527.1 MAG: hypothetical protein COX32_02965 [Candidatus Moranbacteria bacterium CG23_combo_of_CG06-09_8_20_14_all_41_28]PIV85943.1 MAG: hypothetical protein COW50_04215 [Candidatus Moranbacteria bacterium CG17_big_fil_post_rev_8_21_14_2_50_41_107]PIW93930.1 MAG: hypothetical protein COZ86_03765 [Candidatus Moranbacteria bacterium CG_
MNKISLRIILVSFFLLLFGGSFFAVLAAEEDKRIAKIRAEREQFLASAKETADARTAYLEGLTQSREAARQEMQKAKGQYETLLKNQPALVKQNEKTTTTTVKQLVPVASSSNVASSQTTKSVVSKPKATTKSKAS